MEQPSEQLQLMKRSVDQRFQFIHFLIRRCAYATHLRAQTFGNHEGSRQILHGRVMEFERHAPPLIVLDLEQARGHFHPIVAGAAASERPPPTLLVIGLEKSTRESRSGCASATLLRLRSAVLLAIPSRRS